MEYGIDEFGRTVINGFPCEQSERKAHAEVCPVCGESGKLQECYVVSSGTSVEYKTCHACKGDGWIVVPDTI